MNTVASCSLIGPYNKTDECAKFVIDDLTYPYKFSDVANIGTVYTLSIWVKSDEGGSVSIGNKGFSVTSDWTHCAVTFTATSNDIFMYFLATGTYYVYHAQLEIGTKATDWTPSPEDVDQSIGVAQDAADNAQDTADNAQDTADNAYAQFEILQDSLRMLVTKTVTTYDEEGNVIEEHSESVMTQTENGWTFDMTSIKTDINNVAGNLDSLRNEYNETDQVVQGLSSNVSDIEEKTAYITLTTESDQPCIELGSKDADGNPSDFKVRITNTDIKFMEGSVTPAYISNEYLNIEKAIVKEELQQGKFIWRARENNNLGLIWIGGDD